MKTLQEMTDEIREVNVAHGWRPAEGGPGGNTWGDYIALLHSEVSEALEAYRDHRLADATALIGIRQEHDEHGHPRFMNALPKPEGVGSELADVLIRLLDMCDVFGIALYGKNDRVLADVTPMTGTMRGLVSFGDCMAMLHKLTVQFGDAGDRSLSAPWVLRGLVTVARRHGIDLNAEYERKIAYNRTRPYQHGGRTVADWATA